MEILMTRWFARYARKQGISYGRLCDAVDEMSAGLVDADLGGGLLKKRVARDGSGKRGGYRVLVASNLGDRWVFVYGFAKSERDNVEPAEEQALKLLARELLAMRRDQIDLAIATAELVRVERHGGE